jgi:hypothetical protein
MGIICVVVAVILKLGFALSLYYRLSSANKIKNEGTQDRHDTLLSAYFSHFNSIKL